MSDSDESRTVRRQVDEAIVEARQARTYFLQAGAGGTELDETALLRNKAIQLFSIVKPRRDAVKDTWQEYGLDQFAAALSSSHQVKESKNPRLSSPPSVETHSAVGSLSGQQLAQVIDGLLECCIELGWAEDTSDKTVLEKGTIEDVRWLVATREQSKAVDELLPPGADEEVLSRIAMLVELYDLEEFVSIDEAGDELATDGGAAAMPASGAGPQPELPQPRFPFKGPFFQLIAERKDQGKDAKIAVSSANAETGVGKSTCAYYLAHVLDTSPDGFDVEDKGTLAVDSFLNAYKELPKGSSLILDESEQLTGRRAMAQQNVDAAERWQMCRVAEICSFLTLPKFSVLDPLMKDLVDFRIEVERRGLATVYKKSHRPFSDTWWQAIQQFEYPAMDGTRGMEALHAKKDEFIDDDQEERVPESEAKKQAEKTIHQKGQEWRDETIRQLSQQGLTYPEVHQSLQDMVDKNILPEDLLVSETRVGQIARGD